MNFEEWFEEYAKVAGMLPYNEESFGSQLKEFMKEAYKAGWNNACLSWDPDNSDDYSYTFIES